MGLSKSYALDKDVFQGRTDLLSPIDSSAYIQTKYIHYDGFFFGNLISQNFHSIDLF